MQHISRKLRIPAPAAVAAILVALAVALLSGWPAQAQQATQNVWSGNLTVAATVGSSSHGFSPLIGGSLSPTTFTFLGDDYEIIAVTGPRDSDATNPLRLIFGGGKAGDKVDRDLLLLRLTEGATVRTYSLSTAQTLEINAPALGGNVTALSWPATFAHLGWEAGDTIQLDLERVNREATGAPTITGTPKVGETLTAHSSGISDPDGNANATYSYQWIASDGTVDSDIDGAIHGTYSPAYDQVGNFIKVRASFSDDAGFLESRTSAATTEVEADDLIELSKTAINILEATTDTYTVVLTTQPTAGVTIDVAGAGDATVSPASLTFSTTNWSTAQTVTVSADDDDDAVADEEITLTHDITGTGDYISIDDQEVSVTIIENDEARVNVSRTEVTVQEEGTDGSYDVSLSAEPSADVTVTITGHDGTAASLSSSTLTFTPTNWGTAQTVTVSAAHDDDAADSTVTLKHAVAGAGEYAGTDPSEVEGVVIPGTTGYPVPDVVVTIEDNDTAAVTVNPVNLTVAEGAEATYTLVLTSEPVGYVEIAAHVDGSTTALQTVTFTASDWDDPRTVAFTPPEDADINDSAHTVSRQITTGSSAEYLNASVSDVAITVTDNDSEVSIAAGSNVDEGGTATFTLTRTGNTTTAFDVVVAVSATGGITDQGGASRKARFEANKATAAFQVISTEDKIIGAGGGEITVTINTGDDPEDGVGYVIKSGQDSASITVTDEDTASDVQWGLSLADTTITEGEAGETVTLSITNGYTFAEDQDLTLFWGGSELSDPHLQLESTQSVSTLTLTAGDSSIQGTLVYPENNLRHRFFTSDYGSSTRKLEARLGTSKVAEVTGVKAVDNERSPP